MKWKSKRDRIDVLRASGYAFLRRKEMRCTTKTAIREPLCACKTGVCVVCGADVRFADNGKVKTEMK